MATALPISLTDPQPHPARAGPTRAKPASTPSNYHLDDRAPGHRPDVALTDDPNGINGENAAAEAHDRGHRPADHDDGATLAREVTDYTVDLEPRADIDPPDLLAGQHTSKVPDKTNDASGATRVTIEVRLASCRRFSPPARDDRKYHPVSRM